VTGFLSSLVLLLSQWWTPPLRLQVSACSTFLMMCDGPSMAVFCKESIECCLGIVSRYFCKLLLTIPVAPMITSMTTHFMFHILWISILRFFTLISFQLPFVLRSYLMALLHQSRSTFFSFLFLTIMSSLFVKTSLSVCIPWFHKSYIFMFSYYYYSTESC
jgi:hypothetical protein